MKHIVTVIFLLASCFCASAQSLGRDGIGSNVGLSRSNALFCYAIAGNFIGPSSSGTCMATPATCNGGSDDNAAFASFNAWAVMQTSPVVLVLPPGTCMGIGGNAAGISFAGGVKNLVVIGYGTTFSDNNGAGFGWNFGHVAIIEGLPEVHSSLIATVASGSSSVTLLTPSEISRFNAGDWSLIEGIDLQGFGVPSNPGFFEYVQITAVDSNPASPTYGKVTFTSTLAYTYKSTWPVYDSVTKFLGGPATLIAISQLWNIDVEYRGITINMPNPHFAQGRNVKFNGVTMVGNNCVVPSQNMNFTVINSDLTSCNIEIDKINTNVTYDTVVVNKLVTQSASNYYINVLNSTVLSTITGTAGRLFTINNSTIANLDDAPFYGAGGAISITNSAVTGFTPFNLACCTQKDINLQYTMSAGIISVPSHRTITAAADNGSGKIRLTLNSTTGLLAGQEQHFSTSSQCTGANGGWWILDLVPDGVHLDLQDSTAFSTAASANSALSWSGGFVTVQTSAPHGLSTNNGVAIAGVSPSAYNGSYDVTVVDATHFTYSLGIDPGTETVPGTWAQTCTGTYGTTPVAWAVPGANVNFSVFGDYGPTFQVVDLTQDANYTYIYTTLPGGFPLAPLGTSILGTSGVAYGAVAHPAPKFNCSGCTGIATIVDLNNVGAQGLPIGSYSKRTYTGANSAPPALPIMGLVVSTSATVNTAYTGASGTLGFGWPSNLTTVGLSSFNSVSPYVNGKIASATPRVITPIATSGAQTGDSLAPYGAGSWFLEGLTQPCFFTVGPGACNTPGDIGGTSVTLEFIQNQGVVWPPNY